MRELSPGKVGKAENPSVSMPSRVSRAIWDPAEWWKIRTPVQRVNGETFRDQAKKRETSRSPEQDRPRRCALQRSSTPVRVSRVVRWKIEGK